MSQKPKASVHVKPCNTAQSERHNRRDAEYIKSLNPKKLYVRLDLTKHNASYVAPEMEGVTLDQYLESLRVMVKQKTGRAMQEKDIEYTDKNGKVRTRKGASPIRECVVVTEKNTKLKDLLHFTKEVEKKWGIKALQVHLHRDEGHFDNPADGNTWVPNYHAHIIWDWMDHSTGKSIKLNADDMSTMQDMVAEALDMERGQKKSETGLDHLEREQFIKQKLEKEKKQLEEEKRKAQSEKAKAENKANEAKKQARKANEDKEQAEQKAQEAKEEAKKATEEKEDAEQKTKDAKTELSYAESKITEKQAEIDSLENRITSKEEVLDRLISETRTLRFEKYSDKSAGSDAWKDSLLVGFSNNMIKADETIRYCIHAIQDYAYSGFMCRGGGKHDCIFWPEEAHAIKKVMTSFAEAFKTTLRAIGDWLVWMANKLSKFNDRELYRADKEVKQIADGYYDSQIRKVENGFGGRSI
ncbi:MAG: hypothetical protein IKZ71_02995 [Bacteroidales bacterium]|nr:hypothetical protein [Bacteroidales bacterium]